MMKSEEELEREGLRDCDDLVWLYEEGSYPRSEILSRWKTLDPDTKCTYHVCLRTGPEWSAHIYPPPGGIMEECGYIDFGFEKFEDAARWCSSFINELLANPIETAMRTTKNERDLREALNGRDLRDAMTGSKRSLN